MSVFFCCLQNSSRFSSDLKLTIKISGKCKRKERKVPQASFFGEKIAMFKRILENFFGSDLFVSSRM
jgi:hypothetical protein